MLGITLPGSPLPSLSAPQGHQGAEEDNQEGGGFIQRNGGNARGGVAQGGVVNRSQRGWWCGVRRGGGCSVASAAVGVGSVSAPCLEELEHQKVWASKVHGRHTFSQVLSIKTLLLYMCPRTIYVCVCPRTPPIPKVLSIKT
jgi:hypothetical protein